MTIASDVPHSAGKLPDGYLEIYKFAVEMADRVSGRRLSVGALPVSGALAALAAVHGVDRILLGTVGILLAVSWWTLLHTYRNLAEAKFRLISNLKSSSQSRCTTRNGDT
jgi:hypothetical protein